MGRVSPLAAPQRLTSARDNQGRDLLPWLATTDRVIWEAPPVLDANGGVRQEIVLTFPKPKGATRARLMANVATGLWGSGMIKEMLKLRGRDLESWYASMDGDRTQSAALFAWILRKSCSRSSSKSKNPTDGNIAGRCPAEGHSSPRIESSLST